jgi:hypothetical protein
LGSRQTTTADFDATNADALGRALEQLKGPYALVISGILPDTGVETAEEYEVYALLNNSLNLLVSALHMIRHRAEIEAFGLMRMALEASATSFEIGNHPERRRHYLEGRYKSTAAVSFAKSEFPIVGELWGVLSNVAVHPSRTYFGPRPELAEDGTLRMSVKVFLGKRSQPKWQDELQLIVFSLVTNVVFKLMFLSYGGKLRWRQLLGVDKAFLGETNARISCLERELAERLSQLQEG